MMKKLGVLVLTACLTMMISVSAQQEPKKKKGQRRAPRVQEVQRVSAALKKMDLSEAQQGQAKKILGDYTTKFVSIQKKRREVYTKEQQDQLKASRKKRTTDKNNKTDKKASNKRGNRITLSPEQKKQMAEINKANNQIRTALVKDVMGILEGEQKAKFAELTKRPERKKGKARKPGDKKGKRKKKNADKDSDK